jgi:hypothetical protein
MACANFAGLDSGDLSTWIEPARSSCEQVRAGLGELHIGAALVEPQPAAFDRKLETSLVLCWSGLEIMQQRPVDQLDMDAAVLHGLDGVGDFHQLARGGFCIGEGAGWTSLIIGQARTRRSACG